MADVLIAKTCPECKGRSYTKKGEKFTCPSGCVPKKKKVAAKPKAPVVVEPEVEVETPEAG